MHPSLEAHTGNLLYLTISTDIRSFHLQNLDLLRKFDSSLHLCSAYNLSVDCSS